MPLPDGTPHYRLTVRLPSSLKAELKEHIRRTPGLILSDVVRRAMQDWTDAREAEHGGPFPAHGQMNRGRPWDEEREEVADYKLSVLIPNDLHERWLDAVFAQESPLDYKSRALEEALRTWIKVYAD